MQLQILDRVHVGSARTTMKGNAAATHERR